MIICNLKAKKYMIISDIIQAAPWLETTEVPLRHMHDNLLSTSHHPLTIILATKVAPALPLDREEIITHQNRLLRKTHETLPYQGYEHD